jgi:uncharacterized SAM-binding protein YcdF (DUF218 family)
MELLFLLLLIPLVWLLLLPSRLAGTLRRHRITGAGVLALIAVAGFLMLLLNRPADVPTDYAQGDAALRAMLE